MTKSKRSYTRYSSNAALKNGSAATIYRHVSKEPLSEEYHKLRESHRNLQMNFEALRNENEQLKVVKDQKDQQMKDNKKLIETLANRNQRIKELDVEIIQRDNEIKTLKDTSVHRNEVNVLEGKLKKKAQEIKELETKINQTKINHLYHLENQINQLKQENEKLKAKLDDVKEDNPQSRFDMIRVLSDDIQKVMKENESLKEKLEFLNKVKEDYFTTIKDRNNDIEILKEEHGELIEKLDDIQKVMKENEELSKANQELKKERDDYKGLSEEWREQSNEICNLMGKDTDGWSNIAGDTLIDVKDLLYERDTLKTKLDEYRKISTQLFDLE